MTNDEPLSPSVPVAEILERGREILEAKGLTKGAFLDVRTGAACAVGAIQMALGIYDSHFVLSATSQEFDERIVRSDEVVKALAGHLGLREQASAVFFWNDASTLDEVLSGFDKAIWEEREELPPPQQIGPNT